MKKSIIGMVAAGMLLVGTAFGTVNITDPTLTVTADTAENSSGGGSYTAVGNIVIAEGLNTDFAAQTNATLILTAPTNWVFNAGVGTATFTSGRDITNSSIVVTTNTITVTFSATNTAKADTLTIGSIQAKPLLGTVLGTQTVLRLTNNPGTATITGAATNTLFASLKQTAGAAKILTFQTEPPTNATAGVVFTPQPVILVQDQFGSTRNTANGVTDNSTSVTAARTAGVGSGTLQGTLTRSAANGVVTYTSLKHNVATNISITFTGAGTNIVSGDITVNPASASKLVFVTSPGSAVAGTPFGVQPTVRTQDSLSNDSVIGLGTNVTVTMSITTGTGTLLGTKTANIGTAGGNGLVTFTDLQINTTGVNKQLAAAASGLSTGTSATFTVSPDDAIRLAMQSQPSSSATAGTAFNNQPVVRLEDQFGNTVTTDSSTVISAGIATGSGTLQGTTNVTVANGVATFSGLNHQVAGSITLSFSGGSLPSTNSNPITINAATAKTLAFSTSPGLSTAGAVFPAQPVIKTRDLFGNNSTVSLGNDKIVTITLSSGTGPLLGTVTGNIGNNGGAGTLSLTNLHIDIAGTNKQLTATLTGFTNGVSSVFTVQPTNASKLKIQTQPAVTATAGAAFVTQPVVRVEDTFGNLVDTDNSRVISVSRNAGTGVLGGTTSVTASGGVAAFTDLFHTVATTINLTFTAAGLTPTTSTNVAISAGAASQLVFTTEPGGGTAGLEFPTQPVVKTRDAFGNLSTIGLGASQLVKMELTAGPGNLLGTTNIDLGTGAGNGVATFTNLQVNAAGTNDQLTATSTGFGSVQSAFFDVAPGSQTITFDPIANRVYGDAAFTVTATASSGLPVTFSIISGPATNAGNVVTITGAGPVTVRAIQDGDTTWSPATADRSFTVVPAPLTVAANDKTRAYGQTNPVFSASYSGFVNGDTNNVLTGELSLTTVATVTSATGDYPISVSGQSSSNYVITYLDGMLTVQRATLTASAQSVSRTYGEANPAFSGTNSANPDGLTATFSSAATTNSPVGIYAIVPSFADPNSKLTNYTVESSGELTVTKAALSVNGATASRGYGAANPLFSGGIAGVQNNENITAAFTSDATTGSPVGNYPLHAILYATNGLGASDVTMLDNYLMTTNGLLTITNVPLVITANNASRFYGTTNPVFTGTMEGIVNGDDISANYLCVATQSSAAADYPIHATLNDPSSRLTNYSVTLVDGTLTIIDWPSLKISGTNTFQVQVIGPTNQIYHIQAASSLSSGGDWQTIGDTALGSSGLQEFQDVAPTNSSRVYRIAQ